MRQFTGTEERKTLAPVKGMGLFLCLKVER